MSVAAVALTLFFPCAGPSWAGSPQDEICDFKADFLLGLEDYAAAIALHREVLHAHNDNALAHYHLGFAYGMTGRTSDEISEYLVAARLGLAKWDLFLNLGLAYLGQNESQKAANALQTAVKLGPDHLEAHFNLAIVYQSQNRLNEALREITAARRLAPEDFDAANTNATICAEMGDAICARDIWTHIAQVAPDCTTARINLMILNQREEQVRQREPWPDFSNLRTQIDAIRTTQGPR